MALESTLLAHGLPFPENETLARELDAIIRGAGAVPATVAVVAGEPVVGLDEAGMARLVRSHGMAKLSARDLPLAIARAIATKPKVLMLDELSMGLAPIIVDEAYRTLEQIRDAGTTLLIVEQSATRAMLTGGRMILLRSGEVALEGDARELVKGDALKKAYFGYGDH